MDINLQFQCMLFWCFKSIYTWNIAGKSILTKKLYTGIFAQECMILAVWFISQIPEWYDGGSVLCVDVSICTGYRYIDSIIFFYLFIHAIVFKDILILIKTNALKLIGSFTAHLKGLWQTGRCYTAAVALLCCFKSLPEVPELYNKCLQYLFCMCFDVGRGTRDTYLRVRSSIWSATQHLSQIESIFGLRRRSRKDNARSAVYLVSGIMSSIKGVCVWGNILV